MTARHVKTCDWCSRPFTARRSDALTCSVSCRQARHRASVRRVELEATDKPLRLAYADPPYPGLSKRYYGEHVDYAGEVDHAELMSHLQGFDGWALSTSARALPMVLGLCVAHDVAARVAIWDRRCRPHATARILNGWEPVIYVPARVAPGSCSQIEDVLRDVTPRHRSTLPGAVTGMKPPAFSCWVFDLIGALPGDSLLDMFPGSGLVGRTFDLSRGPANTTCRADRGDT